MSSLRAAHGAAVPMTALRSINALELSGIEHMRRGEHEAAERDLLEALRLRTELHPDQPNHASLGGITNNLAVLNLKQHRLVEAAADRRVMPSTRNPDRKPPRRARGRFGSEKPCDHTAVVQK